MLLSAVGWFHHHELRLCRVANQRSGQRVIRAMRWATRIGDAPLWFTLAYLMHWTRSDWLGLRMALALGAGALVCRTIKRTTGRDRPFAAYPDIQRLAAPIDRYSFPSGHTLHAVSSAVIVSHAAPALAPLIWGLAAAVGASRVVLGFHYPTDVVAGATIGATIGAVAISG